MQTHIKVLGWLYIALGIVGLVMAACVSTIIFGGGLLSDDRTAITVTGIVAAVVGGILIITSVPGIIAGAGLINLKPWSRIMTLVLGILNLPGFPIGTVLGIYTLYVLLDVDSTRVFDTTA